MVVSMKTLAIISQKGGSGKTTIAVHVAVCASQRKLKTAIIDIDPQRSAYQWNQSRPDGMKLDAVTANASQLAVLLAKAKAGGIDLAIIDSAPHSDSEAAIAAQLADYVLIPCRPARFDLYAIASTVDIAKAANTPAAVVINAAPRGRLADEGSRRPAAPGRPHGARSRAAPARGVQPCGHRRAQRPRVRAGREGGGGN